MIGETLGPYRVVKPLGKGGMGEVYLARDQRLGRDVALKVLPPSADRRALARFVHEARTVAALKHPNIAVLLDVGKEGETAYLVIELVEGDSLQARLARGALPPDEVIRAGVNLASALDHAHGLGVLHRDIKPANIMLSRQRGAVLLDFGVAQWVRPGASEAEVTQAPTVAASVPTEEGKALGTAPYMSPEQIAGKDLDARSDLFQLGTVLFQAAAGRHPFQGETLVDIQHAILREPAPALSVSGAPAELSRIVAKLLEKDPSYRYPNARALEVDLRSLQRDTETGSVLHVARPPGRRKAWLAAAAVAILAIAAAALFSLRPGAPPPPAVPQRIVPLIAEGPAADPSFAPDGKSLVFSWKRDGAWDLWIKLIIGGSPVQITRTPEMERQPAWSPDGTRIAFVRRDEDGRTSIFAMRALGGDERRLVQNASDPAWSPDGRWLAYADFEGGWARLARIAPDGDAEMQPITGREEGYFHRRPAWTPDGQEIVFNRSPGGLAGELMRVPAAGGVPQPITEDPPGTSNLSAQVTPDGRFVVHVSDRGGAVNLWRIPLRGGAAERITSGPGRDTSPAMSPDGTGIAFVNEPPGTRLLSVDPASGRSRVLLDLAGGEAWAPDMSGDGGWIAFSRKLPGRPWEPAVVSAAGGEPTLPLSGQPDALWARFLPDGGSILFHARGPQGMRVGRVDRGGGAVEWLTSSQDDASYPDVSPDGRFLVFVRGGEGRSEVVVRELAGGTERALVRNATLPAFSPDGSRIAVARSRSYTGGVGWVALAGGAVQWLTGSGTWPTWMPDGSAIAFADGEPDGRQAAWMVSVGDGRTERLGVFRWEDAHYPFVVHPTSGELVTSDFHGGPATLWLAAY